MPIVPPILWTNNVVHWNNYVANGIPAYPNRYFCIFVDLAECPRGGVFPYIVESSDGSNILTIKPAEDGNLGLTLTRYDLLCYRACVLLTKSV